MSLAIDRSFILEIINKHKTGHGCNVVNGDIAEGNCVGQELRRGEWVQL